MKYGDQPEALAAKEKKGLIGNETLCWYQAHCEALIEIEIVKTLLRKDFEEFLTVPYNTAINSMTQSTPPPYLQ